MPVLRWGSADHRIEDPEVIEKILAHLDEKGVPAAAVSDAAPDVAVRLSRIIQR